MNMNWRLTYHADPRAALIADRHYSRQTIGSRQFCPPGRKVVLVTPDYDALWVTSWQAFKDHLYPQDWCCSLFRNESSYLSSELIRQALAATAAIWGGPREMITFVDSKKVYRKRDPGRCFRKAGFREIGLTKGGLIVLGIDHDAYPQPEYPISYQYQLATGVDQ